ncbi:rRNA 2'-O-methyltransferase fibrillarin 1-like [Apium graveolens]|uniref:rRNA 2'-O-methyltransferase fibrillarin 1-like n=1 Tax=Apium graveolens TaxID=4045 RepID=UPI003D79F566
MMSDHIVRKTKLTCICSDMISDVMRGLPEKIGQFICLQPRELDRAQLYLARLRINQARTIQEKGRVVLHRFEGLFSVKGDKDILCTRNLVPGEALYGENLIHVQNEDGTEVEYRIWDPLRSKLGAAIHQGVSNIWIKPGSRVLYIGNVCGRTVSDLSDLIGLEGLVYVVGLSDDVADMAGNRPNVLTIKSKLIDHYSYRMLVGMVDVIFFEIDHHPEQQFCEEGFFLVNNARYYLRAAGHYMISRQVKVTNSTCKFIFNAHDYLKEFKPIETVMIDMREGAYALEVGGYRMRV